MTVPSAAPPFEFETARLGAAIAQPSSIDDAKFSFLVRNQARTREALGAPPPTMSVETSQKWLRQRYEDMYLRYGYGNYILYLKGEEARPVGLIAMVREIGSAAPDIGFALLDEENGKGYATEATLGLVEHCRKHCGVTGVLGFTRAENTASQRVLEKSGLTLQAVVSYKLGGKVLSSHCYGQGDGVEGRADQYYRDIIVQRAEVLRAAKAF